MGNKSGNSGLCSRDYKGSDYEACRRHGDLTEVFIKYTVKAELHLHFLDCIIQGRRHFLIDIKREEGKKENAACS